MNLYQVGFYDSLEFESYSTLIAAEAPEEALSIYLRDFIDADVPEKPSSDSVDITVCKIPTQTEPGPVEITFVMERQATNPPTREERMEALYRKLGITRVEQDY